MNETCLQKSSIVHVVIPDELSHPKESSHKSEHSRRGIEGLCKFRQDGNHLPEKKEKGRNFKIQIRFDRKGNRGRDHHANSNHVGEDQTLENPKRPWGLA